MFSAHDVMLVAVTGTVVGFVSGSFGVGGGFLLVPILNILLGIDINLAVGGCACQVLGQSTTSLLARRASWDHSGLPLMMTGGLLMGVFCGTQVLERAKDLGEVAVWGSRIAVVDLVVLSIFCVLLTALGSFSLWKAHRRPPYPYQREGWVGRLKLPPYTKFSKLETGQLSIPALAWFGVCVGFFAGLLGTSGGLILLPGLVYVVGLRTHDAITVSLVIIWIVSLSATAVHAWNGNVRPELVAGLLVGGTVGAQLGTEFSLRARGRHLRRGFAYLQLGVAGLILLRLGWQFV